MRSLRTLLTVVGAVTVLVLAGNTVALASTGHSFVLGKKNTAGKVTTLKRTSPGPALKLRTSSSSAAPLAVNGRGKVANLNADRLDGYDASALRTTSYSWTKAVTAPTVDTVIAVPLPPGTYVVGYAAYMQGGGLDGATAGCYFYRTRPSAPTTYWGEARHGTVTGDSVGMTGSSLVTIVPGDAFGLYCFAPKTWTTSSNEPIQIYATRTAIASTAALRTAPSSARLAH